MAFAAVTTIWWLDSGSASRSDGFESVCSLLLFNIIVSHLPHGPAPLVLLSYLFVANSSLSNWSCMANNLVVVIVLRQVDAVVVVFFAWMAFASGVAAHRRWLFTKGDLWIGNLSKAGGLTVANIPAWFWGHSAVSEHITYSEAHLFLSTAKPLSVDGVQSFVMFAGS
jgi:hypothetical protein